MVNKLTILIHLLSHYSKNIGTAILRVLQFMSIKMTYNMEDTIRYEPLIWRYATSCQIIVVEVSPL